MLIHGSPLAVKLPQAFGDDERFWYWRGVSGKRYIHSVYPLDNCPPLPGAVYLAVRREGDRRSVIAAGRFSPCWDDASPMEAYPDADEIHVHLLAQDNNAAEDILQDLRAVLDGGTRSPLQ
jgi:hypothetical protein